MSRGTDYDVKCMLCSAEVGQILGGRFTQHGCGLKMPSKGAMLRCCHCGGSLYRDPLDVYAGGIDRAQIRKLFASSAA